MKYLNIILFITVLFLTQSVISKSSFKKKNISRSLLKVTQPKLYPDGWFNIIGKDDFCVSAEVRHGSLVQQKCGAADELSWKAENTPNGLVIQSKNGLAFDNRGYENKNGNPVFGWTRHGGPNQVWFIEPTKNSDLVQIRNPQTNKCFDVPGGVAGVGKTYHIWECVNGHPNQSFRLKPVVRLYPDGWFNIIGKDEFCVSAEVRDGSLVQQKCGAADELSWKAENTPNGLVIQSKNGMVFDNSGYENKNGNAVFGWTRHGGPNQVWFIEPTKNSDLVQIRNPQTNKCFDVPAGLGMVGGSYLIWECVNGHPNQSFRLKPIA